MKKILISLAASSVLLLGIDADVKIKSDFEAKVSKLEKRLGLTEQYLYFSNEVVDQKDLKEVLIKQDIVKNQALKNSKKIETIVQALDSGKLKSVIKDIDTEVPDNIDLKIQNINKKIQDILSKEKLISEIERNNGVLTEEIAKLKSQIESVKTVSTQEGEDKTSELKEDISKLETIMFKLVENPNVVNKLKEESSVGDIKAEILAIYRKITTLKDDHNAIITANTNDLRKLEELVEQFKSNVDNRFGDVDNKISKLNDKLVELTSINLLKIEEVNKKVLKFERRKQIDENKITIKNLGIDLDKLTDTVKQNIKLLSEHTLTIKSELKTGIANNKSKIDVINKFLKIGDKSNAFDDTVKQMREEVRKDIVRLDNVDSTTKEIIDQMSRVIKTNQKVISEHEKRINDLENDNAKYKSIVENHSRTIDQQQKTLELLSKKIEILQSALINGL